MFEIVIRLDVDDRDRAAKFRDRVAQSLQEVEGIEDVELREPAPSQRRPPTKAESFLTFLLGWDDAPMEVARIRALADAQGITKDELDGARRRLGIRAVKRAGDFGTGGAWGWEWPHANEPT